MNVRCVRCAEDVLWLEEDRVDRDHFVGFMFGNNPVRPDWPLNFTVEATTNDLLCPGCDRVFVEDDGRLYDGKRYWTASEVMAANSQVVLTASGEPFKTWNAANLAASKRPGAEVVEHGDGYALRV